MKRVITGRAVVTLLFVAGLAVDVAVPARSADASARHVAAPASSAPAQSAGAYNELLELFTEFRAFSQAGYDGAMSNYPAAMQQKAERLQGFQQRLAAIDVSSWPVPEQVDYHLVRGEMNGLEFELRVKRPWERDPGFYSLNRAGLGRLPAPPIVESRQRRVRQTLQSVPGFFDAAKANLGGGDISRVAGDFALLALHSMEPAAADFSAYVDQLATRHPDLATDARNARAAVESYLEWLRTNREAMTAIAGVGLDNYNWLLKNVYLFPYTWEECLSIVHLEDNRVITFLKLEQNRNRDLPPLEPVDSQEAYRQSVLDALDHIDRFIREEQIYTVPDYLVDDEYRQERIEATSEPWPEPPPYFRVFSYREPLMEETHELVGHHYDLLRQQNGSHPIRDNREHEGPYAQSVARWEGLAFAYEELLMHAGYLDGRSPRGREIVYEQAAYRTVRALSDLYQHAGEWDLAEAFEFSAANAPHGELLPDSNQLWNEVGDTTLRMTGWHAQMVVGKVQFMKLLRDRAQQLGDDFVLGDFMDEFYGLSALPMSLIRWQMTGYTDEIENLW